MQARRFKDEDYIAPGGEVSLRNFSRGIINVLEERPEAVILAGDMFDERQKTGELVVDSEAAKYWPSIRSELTRLAETAIYGVYALRGNHDSAPVLKELQNSLGNRFHFVRNEEQEIGDLKIYFMETHYEQGSYGIAEETIPSKGEILVMHETLPSGVPGLEREVIQKLSERFALLLNGHMHFYGRRLLGMNNLYSLPAMVPSEELKNNYTVEYQWPGDIDNPKVRPSPFGYVILDGHEVTFKRLTPIQSIVNVKIEAENPGQATTGIHEVYSKLAEREDADNLWVWVSATGVTFEDTIRKETNKYPQIRTMEISVKSAGQAMKPVELKGLDKVMTLSELKDTVLTLLTGSDKDLAQDMFDEILTSDNLSRRLDSNVERTLFETLLELAGQRYGVPEEHIDEFLFTIRELWKMR